MSSNDSTIPSHSAAPYQGGLTPAIVAARYGLAPAEIHKLSSNENPTGPPTAVIKVLEERLRAQPALAWERYPEIYNDSLAAALAAHHQLPPALRVVCGNGMDNVLETLVRSWLRPGQRVLLPRPSFRYYELVSSWAGSAIESVAVNYQLPSSAERAAELTERLLAALASGGQYQLLWLCSPNNPDGLTLNDEQLTRLLAAAADHGCLTFLDEAYIEYADHQSRLSWVDRYPRLIVGRTFSKAYGLAALRIGWAALHESLFEDYRRHQTPFSLTNIAALAAKAALSPAAQRELQSSQAQILTDRQWLLGQLSSLGYEALTGAANFVAWRAGGRWPGGSSELTEALLRRGWIVRAAGESFVGAPVDLIRATVGTTEECQGLIDCLAQLSTP